MKLTIRTCCSFAAAVTCIEDVTLGALIVLALARGAQYAMGKMIGGKIFTGKKWSLADNDYDETNQKRAYQIRNKFLSKIVDILDVHHSRCEIPLLTRYCIGEQQRAHTDGRPIGDKEGMEEYMSSGGQRLVQVVAYLNTLEEGCGGATAIHDYSLQGLKVQPQKVIAFRASRHAGFAFVSG